MKKSLMLLIVLLVAAPVRAQSVPADKGVPDLNGTYTRVNPLPKTTGEIHLLTIKQAGAQLEMEWNTNGVVTKTQFVIGSQIEFKHRLGRTIKATAEWSAGRLLVTGHATAPNGDDMPYRMLMTIIGNDIRVTETFTGGNTEFKLGGQDGETYKRM